MKKTEIFQKINFLAKFQLFSTQKHWNFKFLHFLKLKKAKNSKKIEILAILSYYYLKNSKKTEKIQKNWKKQHFYHFFTWKKEPKTAFCCRTKKNSQKQHSAAQLFEKNWNFRYFSAEKIPGMSRCKTGYFGFFQFCRRQNLKKFNLAFSLQM